MTLLDFGFGFVMTLEELQGSGIGQGASNLHGDTLIRVSPIVLNENRDRIVGQLANSVLREVPRATLSPARKRWEMS